MALLCTLAFPLFSLAQTGTVRGFVYDEATGEPSIFTPVSLRGATDHGAQTDVNGYFSISKVPPGHFTLQVVYFGYDTVSKEVDIKAYLIQTEQRRGIVPPQLLLHPDLAIEEGRTLREKHGEGRQGRILHLIEPGVALLTPVRQSPECCSCQVISDTGIGCFSAI